jgi:hypothetical protein
MKLIDELVELDLAAVRGSFALILQATKPYFDKNMNFEPVWLIEILAQGAAGLFYFQCGTVTEPPLGFLVGLDGLSISMEEPLLPGNRLIVMAELVTEFYPFGMYTCQAYLNDTCLAQGNFKFVADQRGQVGTELMKGNSD